MSRRPEMPVDSPEMPNVRPEMPVDSPEMPVDGPEMPVDKYPGRGSSVANRDRPNSRVTRVVRMSGTGKCHKGVLGSIQR